MTKNKTISTIYMIALTNLLVLAGWASVSFVPALVSTFGASQLMPAMEGFMAVCLAVVAAPFIYLTRRPWGWGKLVLGAAGLAWIMNGAMTMLMSKLGFSLHIGWPGIPIVCGVLMICLAVWHQVVDRTFFVRPSA